MAPFQQGPPPLQEEPDKKLSRLDGVEGKKTEKAANHPKPEGHGFSN